LDRPVGDWGLDDLLGSAFAPCAPLWVADGLLVLSTDQDAVRCLWLGLDGTTAWRSPREQCISWPVTLADGAIAGVVAGAGAFAEVGVVTVEGNGIRTAHNAALAADIDLRVPERVEIETPEGTLQGWDLSPRGTAAPAPGLLYMHGGPHVAYGARVIFEMHWLADQGFGVTWGNPRGSQGSGEAWARAITPRWGPAETPDFLALAEHMAARPEVDANRLGVTGGSYGGYMTLYLAEHTDRFRAGVADRGLYDWSLSWAAGDFGRFLPLTLGLPSPPDDPAAYAEYTLLRDTGRVTIPFLVMHALDDLRCDMGQALALFDRLKVQGTPTALVLFPEEGHGLSRGGRLDRRQERMRQIAGWFRRWL
jgi:dipeptidyl aminopeptidase/acylaminoacyl peptidase